MARKHKHEEHLNHEAWAIPYGDLITLLLAFFVVMYSMSSVNEGKYRVLADSLSAAFGGPPRSVKPVQFGEKQKGEAPAPPIHHIETPKAPQIPVGSNAVIDRAGPAAQAARLHQEQQRARLTGMAKAVEQAMGELISRKLIVVTRTEQWLEIEIRTDILYSSGSASISPDALPVLARLAAILKPFGNTLRIEGHTDNVPIATTAFPSNWELSAARAASVVHLFMEQGVEPRRMTVAGFGEYRPLRDNASLDGRNHNRRVVIVVQAEESGALPPIQAEADPLPPPAATLQAEVTVPAGTLERLRGT